MLKKYSFRLEAVLKLRKLKEENCRMEMGRLLLELNRIDDQLAHDRAEIEKYFLIQEETLKKGVRGSQVQSLPMLVEGKDRNIQLLTKERAKQEQKIAEKKLELATLKGELKVMENMKDKDFQEYKRLMNKEIDQKVEEQTQIWMNQRDKA